MTDLAEDNSSINRPNTNPQGYSRTLVGAALSAPFGPLVVDGRQDHLHYHILGNPIDEL